jgi:hypothetical protein
MGGEMENREIERRSWRRSAVLWFVVTMLCNALVTRFGQTAGDFACWISFVMCLRAAYFAYKLRTPNRCYVATQKLTRVKKCHA